MGRAGAAETDKGFGPAARRSSGALGRRRLLRGCALFLCHGHPTLALAGILPAAFVRGGLAFAFALAGVYAFAVDLLACRFVVLGQENVAAPLGTAGERVAPGEVEVRPGEPGVDYSGPDVFFLLGQPEGLLCGVRIDSF